MTTEESIILIVDDKPDNLKLLISILEDTNYDLSIAQDGNSCLSIANSEKVDLILLDIVLPDINGFDICAKLKSQEKTKDIPVIFMTGLADSLDKVKGFELGAVDYITKPFDTQEVLARINTHLTIQKLKNELQHKNIELQKFLDREKETNRLKGKLLSLASHDLRTPLTTINLSSNLLRNPNIPIEKKSTYLDKIEKSVKQTIKFLDDIVFYSRIEQGKIEFNPKVLSIDDFCKSIIGNFHFVLDQKHQVELINECNIPSIYADPILLEHILENLIHNSVKYSPKGGTIRITINCKDHYISLSVEDNGIGIPQESIPLLFQDFYRADNAKSIKGTGLGLALVKQFVDMHNGWIDVKSNLNIGTKFTLHFPLSTNLYT